MSEPKKVIYPEWAEWKAIDSDGLLWAFESEPLLNDRWHYTISGRAAVIQTGLPTEGWETSLERINKEVLPMSDRDLRKLAKGEIGYVFKKGKYVFCKDGVYFSLDFAQIKKMRTICREIITIENRVPPINS